MASAAAVALGIAALPIADWPVPFVDDWGRYSHHVWFFMMPVPLAMLTAWCGRRVVASIELAVGPRTRVLQLLQVTLFTAVAVLSMAIADQGTSLPLSFSLAVLLTLATTGTVLCLIPWAPWQVAWLPAAPLSWLCVSHGLPQSLPAAQHLVDQLTVPAVCVHLTGLLVCVAAPLRPHELREADRG